MSAAAQQRSGTTNCCRTPGLTLPAEMPYGQHVYHLYVIQADDREGLRQQLNAAGIETGLHYPVPLHLQEAYANLGYSKGSFPVSERLTGAYSVIAYASWHQR